MPLTLAEAMRKLEDSKYRRVVWNEIVRIISQFVDSETRKADSGIGADGCTSQVVPQEIIQQVIDEVNVEKIEPLEEYISYFENLTVEETDVEQEEKPKTKARPKQGQGQKRVKSIRGRSRKQVNGAD